MPAMMGTWASDGDASSSAFRAALIRALRSEAVRWCASPMVPDMTTPTPAVATFTTWVLNVSKSRYSTSDVGYAMLRLVSN